MGVVSGSVAGAIGVAALIAGGTAGGIWAGGKSKEAKKKAQQAAQRIAEIGRMTPEEREQYGGSFELGKLVEDILKYEQGVGDKPTGYLTPEQQYTQQGPLASEIYSQRLAGAQDPYAAFESSLRPQLQLAEDYINRRYQAKGLIRSGMPIEQMGRAGVELAVSEAQNRMAFRSQELQAAQQLQGITQQVGQQNLSDTAGLYQFQQNIGQSQRAREVGYGAYPGQLDVGIGLGESEGYSNLIGDIIGSYGNLLTAAGGVGGAKKQPTSQPLSYEEQPFSGYGTRTRASDQQLQDIMLSQRR